MLLYDVILFISQLSIFVDDTDRYSDLTDIMEKCCIIHLQALLFTHSISFGYHCRILGNTKRMAVGIRILGINRIYESCCSLFKQTS